MEAMERACESLPRAIATGIGLGVATYVALVGIDQLVRAVLGILWIVGGYAS